MAGPAMASTSRSCFDKTGRSTDPNDIDFLLYYDPRVKQAHIKLTYEDKWSVERSPFQVSKATKVLIHGLEQDGYAGFPQIVKDAYLENQFRNDHNVIVVNWSKLAAQNPVLYFDVLTRLDKVANRVADFLLWMGRSMGVDLRRNVHFVGEGVGADVAGLAGSHVIAKGSRIGRITGLDPKDAGYLTVYHDRRLEKSDADFVDVYHTNEQTIEADNLFGHADFFVNRLTAQPWATPNNPENSNAKVAYQIFAQTIMEGPYGNNVTSQVRRLQPNSVLSNPHSIIVGEYCLPGTNGWFDITY